MAVAYDASSEPATSSTGQPSFSWTHTPSGTPAGVLVFTFVNANADDALSVTYGGVSVPAVTGGRAVDTAGEPGDCKTWFLGSSVPTGAQTVEVTRTNNANVMYAVAVTVTAGANTEATGVVLVQESQALSEQLVNDGSPGTNSVRFAGNNSGVSSITAGASSTLIQDLGFGLRAAGVVRETTAGQGSRSVGFNMASDDTAAVHLAIREVASGGAGPLIGGRLVGGGVLLGRLVR